VSPPVVAYGFLSSSPPTPCGIATFTTALGLALVRQGADVRVVRVLDAPEPSPASALAVVGDLIATEPSSIQLAAIQLNQCDVAFIQHEYGLYGGRDGADLLRVLALLRVPLVAILHTVLPTPTSSQREVLDAVIARVDRVIVMSSAAEATLRSVNHLGSTPVTVVPHGAAVVLSTSTRPVDVQPVLLTWGLIGPGKGIEWVIDALGHLRDLDPAPLYVIAGRTHPKVLAHQGDAYRESLERRVRDTGVEHMVIFDNSYRDLPSLNELIESADVVVLPYDSHDQATSGVLVDAVAAGRPVIATAFPHAVELLGSGAGIVVAHKDPVALSRALRRVITEPQLAMDMSKRAQRIAPSLSWDAVGEEYVKLVDLLLPNVAVGA
jgi:polysaccharide biosynthesis protein PslF